MYNRCNDNINRVSKKLFTSNQQHETNWWWFEQNNYLLKRFKNARWWVIRRHLVRQEGCVQTRWRRPGSLIFWNIKKKIVNRKFYVLKSLGIDDKTRTEITSAYIKYCDMFWRSTRSHSAVTNKILVSSSLISSSYSSETPMKKFLSSVLQWKKLLLCGGLHS